MIVCTSKICRRWRRTYHHNVPKWRSLFGKFVRMLRLVLSCGRFQRSRRQQRQRNSRNELSCRWSPPCDGRFQACPTVLRTASTGATIWHPSKRLGDRVRAHFEGLAKQDEDAGLNRGLDRAFDPACNMWQNGPKASLPIGSRHPCQTGSLLLSITSPHGLTISGNYSISPVCRWRSLTKARSCLNTRAA